MTETRESWDDYIARRQRENDARAQEIFAGLPRDQQEFFRRLHSLCLEYNVDLGGCGCCGSPFIAGVNDVKVEAGQLTFDGGKVPL